MMRLVEFIAQGTVPKVLAAAFAVLSINAVFLSGYFFRVPSELWVLLDATSLLSMAFEVTFTVAWTSLLARILVAYAEVAMIVLYRRRFSRWGLVVRSRVKYFAIRASRFIRRRRSLLVAIGSIFFFGAAYLSMSAAILILLLGYLLYAGFGKLVFASSFRVNYSDATRAQLRGSRFLKTVSPQRIFVANLSVWTLVILSIALVSGFLRFDLVSSRNVAVVASTGEFLGAMIVHNQNGIIFVQPRGEVRQRAFIFLPFSAILSIKSRFGEQ